MFKCYLISSFNLFIGSKIHKPEQIWASYFELTPLSDRMSNFTEQNQMFYIYNYFMFRFFKVFKYINVVVSKNPIGLSHVGCLILGACFNDE